MKLRNILTLIVAAATMVFAQNAPLVSSHASATKKPASSTASPAQPSTPPKPAIRVNGAVLTETDVVREMYTIFPYARQHNGGFPKNMEADIRKGAMDMIVFEELVYQEAKRRKLVIPAEKLATAEAKFRKQFPDKAMFNEYLRTECGGSPQVLKEKIRRSFLIDRMLKAEVDQKSTVAPAEAKAYYDKNPKQFEHGETVSIQTISIIPPENATKEAREEAKAKIKDIARMGRAAKTSRDFGLIAEQLSDDDWRTKLGDRGTVDVKALPPEVVIAARAMKAGEVSSPIQLGTAWVVIRLNAHQAAGKTSFAEAKAKLQAELQKQKRVELRASLNQRLRKDAKIEVL